MPPVRIELTRACARGIFFTTSTLAAAFAFVVWTMPSPSAERIRPVVRWEPSGLYTFCADIMHGLARRWVAVK